MVYAALPKDASSIPVWKEVAESAKILFAWPASIPRTPAAAPPIFSAKLPTLVGLSPFWPVLFSAETALVAAFTASAVAIGPFAIFALA